MKKLLMLAAVFAAGFAVTSCSSDSDVVQETSLDNKFDAQGNAYMNIAINLPTTRGGATRANGDFDHGTAAEYDVKNAVLILFKGTDESYATFNGAYTLPTEKVKQTVTNNQISDRLLYTQQINKGENAITSGQHIYAFVAANVNGKFEVTTDRGLTVKAKDGDKVMAKNSTTFSTFRNYALNEIGNPTSGGLLMTNPPLSTAGGGSAAPSSPQIKWMPELTADHIYNSIEEAYAGTKFVEIYLERAAAKIDLTVPSGSSTGLTTDETVKYDPSGILWEVQNYNTNYYLTRHVSETYLPYTSTVLSTAIYRFAEETAVDPSLDVKHYRIPWAEDANYTKSAPDNVPTTGTQPTLSKSINDAVYLAENTVDEESLKQEYTTRIVLAVPFNGGSSFYTSSLGGGDEIFSPDAMVAKVKEYILNKFGKTATEVTITPSGGSASVTSVTLSDASDATAILADLTASVQFSYYLNGMAYYKVLVKHFGDVETPLKSASEILGSSYDDVYPAAKRAEDYLGRYSIVRNNWYRITLDGIKHIGKPTVPEIPSDTPDDEIDAYLKVRINILSWALREQHVTL